MYKQKSIVGGFILIIAGAFILLAQHNPFLGTLLDIERQWPLIFVGIGVMFFIAAVSSNAELAIPGTIMSGLGTLLYYQNVSGNWGSWAYTWTLLPGFVGLGMLITSVLSKSHSRLRRRGVRLLTVSACLFALFFLFFGGSWGWSFAWPVLLIGAGLWLIFNGRRPRHSIK